MLIQTYAHFTGNVKNFKLFKHKTNEEKVRENERMNLITVKALYSIILFFMC